MISNLKKIKDIYAKFSLSDESRSIIIQEIADQITKQSDFILNENKKDLEKIDINDPRYDRILLNTERLIDISNDLKKIASEESPIGRILEDYTTQKGLRIQKITVPLGLIAMIYEARPNVTADVFGICFKSQNACILKSGGDCYLSSKAIVDIIHSVFEKHNVPKDIVYLLPQDRKYVFNVLQAKGIIDVCIPRGGRKLIDFVTENAKVPVIATGAAVVHAYIDQDFNLEYAKDIITESKTRRVSVCNALDTLIINKMSVNKLKDILSECEKKNVKLYCDNVSYEILLNQYQNDLLLRIPNDDFYHTEHLNYALSIKVVESLEEAIEHIQKYSLQHTETIISNNQTNIEKFTSLIDSSVVYVNTSTSFTDGGQFEMGAEIGISTQKLHARGPMSIHEMTSYKRIVVSDGKIRK